MLVFLRMEIHFESNRTEEAYCQFFRLFSTTFIAILFNESVFTMGYYCCVTFKHVCDCQKPGFRHIRLIFLILAGHHFVPSTSESSDIVEN
jgi:hypothetical protein